MLQPTVRLGKWRPPPLDIDMFEETWARAWAVVGLSLVTLFGQSGLVRADDTRVVPTSMQQMQLSFAEVVRKAAPAVVNIYSKRTVRNAFGEDALFKKFFGERQGGGQRVQSALGSGVIV